MVVGQQPKRHAPEKQFTHAMEVLFDEKRAQSYDRWGDTPQGMNAYALEGELLIKLGALAVGQTVLEVGCGTGAHVDLFLKKGLKAMGVDISPPMLRVASKKFGNRTWFCLGDGENLPFKEKSFDCVALITTLEFIPNPARALSEAMRVSRGKVLLGILNKYSFLGIKRRVLGTFRPNVYNRARFYSIWELRKLVIKAIPEAVVDWASVLVLPMGWQQYLPGLERRLSFRRNPLGGFLGLRASIEKT
jgi:ubiquinone/menaquinone biosynthesis C-methylase UbiE